MHVLVPVDDEMMEEVGVDEVGVINGVKRLVAANKQAAQAKFEVLETKIEKIDAKVDELKDLLLKLHVDRT